MMRMIAVMAAAMLALPGAAWASDCDASIDHGRAFPPAADYDPFSASPTVIPFDISINNRSASPCVVRLAMHSTPGARFMRAHGQIQYVITNSSGVILRNDPGALQGLPVQLSAKGKTVVRLAVRIAPGQIVKSGPYNDRIDLDLFNAAGRQIDKTVGLPAQVRVQSRAQINISGVDSPFGTGIGASSIDFGTFVPGAERKVYLQLRSNVDARIRISSENKGVMLNRPLSGETGVPYSLTVDGTLLNLNSVATLQRRAPPTLDGVNYDMVARVGQFGARFAGVYKDTVTLVVEPAE